MAKKAAKKPSGSSSSKTPSPSKKPAKAAAPSSAPRSPRPSPAAAAKAEPPKPKNYGGVIEHDVSLERLYPDPANARRHPERNMQTIMASLRQYGQIEPLVVRLENSQIVGGNGRYEAMRLLGWTACTVTWVDKSAIEAMGLGLTLNRSAEQAEWDLDVLDKQSMHLEDAGVDLTDVGFTDAELDGLLEVGDDEGSGDAGEVEEGEVPEPPAEPTTKPGDVWLLGRHRIMCGDATNRDHMDRLMGGNVADITFTSPPYNAAKDGFLNGRVKGFDPKYADHSDDMTDDEWRTLITDATDNALRVSTYVFVNLQMLARNRQPLLAYQAHYAAMMKDIFVWNKTQCPPNINKGAFNTKWEYVFCISKDARTRAFPCKWQGQYPNVIETESNSANEFAAVHKAGFPVALPHWMISKLDFVASVLDPFCGTGTTIVCAEQMGKVGYGMEIDPGYCDVIVARWESVTGHKAMRQPAVDKGAGAAKAAKAAK